MTEPSNFLSRWSRKKLDAANESPPEKPAPATPAATTAPPAAEGFDRPVVDEAAKKGEREPESFDLASLPSLETIDAQTDIRGFLRAGVPPDLTRAALRRAWSADPAIRDFRGLAENDWDFTDPNGMMGFGDLGPDVDVKRLLASVFGETPRDESGGSSSQSGDATSDVSEAVSDENRANEIASLASDDKSPDDAGIGDTQGQPGAACAPDFVIDENEIVQRDSNSAPQNYDSESHTKSAKRPRSHGRALPQ